MDPNLETALKALSDQMTQLKVHMTDQVNHITTRLDRLEARTPETTHEAQIEFESEPESSTPANPRRVLHQNPLFDSNPRVPNPDRVHNQNPREECHEPNPRRSPRLEQTVEPNPHLLLNFNKYE